MAHELQVRRPAFRIDESVPFQWQPNNPAFGVFGNAFTFIAIAFERYIVSATRQAMPLLSPEVADEAEAFVRQEAQHAKAHRAHAKALIAQYPELEGTLERATEAYDELLERESLTFHLAYIANLEATFTPLFKLTLDNRHALFDGGDDRVGPLFLWHFVEEIEHRSSALTIYNGATIDRSYRLRHVVKVFRHVTSVYSGIVADFEKYVPLEDQGIVASTVSPGGLWRSARKTIFRDVPARDLAAMAGKLVRSQWPRHSPSTESLPAWAAVWHGAYESGDDVTTYEGLGFANAR